jgi:EAL domain-containing protein (putative c-di-GMP-specific phosphodiesterase class I)/DNA-binding response OmpR family regulator
VIDPLEAGTLPILIVDDDAAARGLIRMSLLRAGFGTLEAASGEAALAVLETETVGVVICDVVLPEMSGIDMVRSLRRRAETATLPIILLTGSGNDDTVIAGLDAGADDFLFKPARMAELIARVRAHLRTQAAWSHILQDELRVRSGVVHALGALTLSQVPEETAVAVVTELCQRTANAFVSVAQVTDDGRMQELATFNPRDGVQQGGETFPADLADYLLGRARAGPWVDEVGSRGLAEPTSSFRKANLDLVASAPIFTGDDLVGLLSIGAVADDTWSSRSRQARLLAAAIDYASVLSAVAGSALGGRREAAGLRTRLERILAAQEFHTVVQPIVEVETRKIIGYEALTRFDDGTPPDVRFAEATRAELGAAFELAAIRMAIAEVGQLVSGAFLSINISPRSLIEQADVLREILLPNGRQFVVELTEHVPIEDYPELRAAVRKLGDHVQLAVDDAGAGYASLRHILELKPSYAKLDVSLVRGIDADDLRQALAAGLNYFALRIGCRLIAEGVETQAEADALRRLGIDFAQGYLYGHPGRAADFALASGLR